MPLWLIAVLSLSLACSPLDRAEEAPSAGEETVPTSEHAALEPWNENGWIAHREHLEKARSGQIDLYFLGDSITRRWGALDYPELLEHWNEQFFGWNAANFGWGGDSTHHILWRIRNGQLDDVHPRVIVLLAGTNNIGGEPRPDVAKNIDQGIRAIIDTCREKAPEATIVLMGVFPRNDSEAANQAVAAANRLIEQIPDGETILYLNINHQLTDENGDFLPGMSDDQLHLTRQGYEVWARNLQPILTDLLGPPAAEDHAPPPTGDPSAR